MILPSKQSQPLSVPQLAKRLGVSRTTIHNRVSDGRIAAVKVGHNHVISAETVAQLVGDRNSQIKEAVRRVVSQYGEALVRLARE